VVPSSQIRGDETVSEPTREVLVALFGDATRAAGVRAGLRARDPGGDLALLEALVISRDAEGRLAWDMDGGGGHIGSRADTIATALGVLLSSDAIVSGLTAACRPEADGTGGRRGFGERFVREIGPAVAPGESLVVAVVEHRWLPEVERGLRGYHRLTRSG
jgi:hypothetical protein